jgi:DNA-directed RNA polymerase subunit L
MRLLQLFFVLLTIEILQPSQCSAFSFSPLPFFRSLFCWQSFYHKNTSHSDSSTSDTSKNPPTSKKNTQIPPSNAPQETVVTKRGFLSKVYSFFTYRFGTASKEDVTKVAQKTADDLARQSGNLENNVKTHIKKTENNLNILQKNIGANTITIDKITNNVNQASIQNTNALENLTKLLNLLNGTCSTLTQNSLSLEMNIKLLDETEIPNNTRALNNASKDLSILDIKARDQAEKLEALVKNVNQTRECVNSLMQKYTVALKLLTNAHAIISMTKNRIKYKDKDPLMKRIAKFEKQSEDFNNQALVGLSRLNTAQPMLKTTHDGLAELEN